MAYSSEVYLLILIGMIIGLVIGWKYPPSWWVIIPSWGIFLVVNALPESPPIEMSLGFMFVLFAVTVWVPYTVSSAVKKAFF